MPERIEPTKVMRWRCSVCGYKFATKTEAQQCEKMPIENHKFQIGATFVERASWIDLGRAKLGEHYRSPIYKITHIGVRHWIGQNHKPHHVAVYFLKSNRTSAVPHWKFKHLIGKGFGERILLWYLKPWKPGQLVTASREKGWILLGDNEFGGTKYARISRVPNSRKWKVELTKNPLSYHEKKRTVVITTARLKKLGPKIMNQAKQIAA